MAVTKEVKHSGLIMGKLQRGTDLLDELTGIAVRNGIDLGRVEAIGAVERACIGYYHQEKKEYGFKVLEQGMEIVSLMGNISMKDGKPMVHAHIVLADSSGATFGGHLAQGTTIFACEYVIEIFEGPIFKREIDSDTGLPLWNFKY